MQAKYGQAQRIGAIDRGMVGEENLAFLGERGASYPGAPGLTLLSSIP